MADTSRVLTAFRHLSRAPEVLRCAAVISNWWPVAAAYVGLSRIAFPFDVRCRDGATYRLEEFYDLETLWQIYVRRVYDVRQEHRVILDAGANIGLFACYAALRQPQCTVYAVEPFPGTVRRLRETVRRNGLDQRVHIHDVALSSSAGTARMSAAVSASQMVHLVANSPVETTNAADATDATVAVRTQTLAELIDSLAVPHIDLLKMDIEGSEYDVLGTARPETLARIREITLEYHQPDAASPLRKRDLARHLCSAGGFTLREDPDSPEEYGILHFRR